MKMQGRCTRIHKCMSCQPPPLISRLPYCNLNQATSRIYLSLARSLCLGSSETSSLISHLIVLFFALLRTPRPLRPRRSQYFPFLPSLTSFTTTCNVKYTLYKLFRSCMCQGTPFLSGKTVRLLSIQFVPKLPKPQ